jgi:hypothetical protein
MWMPRPTAQGRRGLDRPLFNLSQPRPGTKLSVPSAQVTGGSPAQVRPLPRHPAAFSIKHEVSLTLKLLIHLRTAAWGFRRPIESVQHAILLLADQGLRRWASVVAIAALGSDQPNELVIAW